MELDFVRELLGVSLFFTAEHSINTIFNACFSYGFRVPNSSQEFPGALDKSYATRSIHDMPAVPPQNIRTLPTSKSICLWIRTAAGGGVACAGAWQAQSCTHASADSDVA
jgi:hypothetical protein